MRALDLQRALGAAISAVRIGLGPSVTGVAASAKAAVRWLSQHTGLPAFVVAAVLVVVGYRVLKRTARFAVEVVVVTLLLALASALGWIRW